MLTIDKDSLSLTLDSLSEHFFYGLPMTDKEKKTVAGFIASRQGLKGSYRGMFAPTEKDFKEKANVFTGEAIKSMVGLSHILSEEASRALLLLNVNEPSVKAALNKANTSFLEALIGYEKEYGITGMYCCGICSVSFFRNLSAGGLNNNEKRLKAGMARLKEHRKGDGEWKRFPFYYTLLALIDIDLKEAREEMLYTLPSCEKHLKSIKGTDKKATRKRDLLKRVLEKVS